MIIKKKNIIKKFTAFLGCLSLVAACMLTDSFTVRAETGGPINSIVSIMSYSDFGAGSALDIEQSQRVEVIVDLNTNVTAPSLDNSDFAVNITNGIGGGLIDGIINPAMDFDVDLVDNNTLKFTIFATLDAEVPNGLPSTATSDFFDMRTRLVTITAASGTSIPSIIDSSASTPLYWPIGTFDSVSIDSGARGYSHDSVVANTSLGVAPSVQFTFTDIAAVRGVVYVAGTSSVDGYIGFSSVVPSYMHYAAPVIAHFFYDMDLADYATALAYNINANSANTGCVAEIAGTPGNSATIKLTKTTGYTDGETLNLYILDHTNQ